LFLVTFAPVLLITYQERWRELARWYLSNRPSILQRWQGKGATSIPL